MSKHRKRGTLPATVKATAVVGATAVLSVLLATAITPTVTALPAAPAMVAVTIPQSVATEQWLASVPRMAHTPPAVPSSPRRAAAAPARTAPAPAPTAAASGKAASAVNVAMAQRGVMYRWGGTTPAGFDCSGLMVFAYAKAGIKLPRTSQAQSSVGRTVSLANIQPGDLLHYGGHVAMAIGNGQLVESSTHGKPVATRKIYTRGLKVIKRIA